MEYAIISLHKKQFLVKPGTKFSMLGKLGNEGDIISDAKVLLYKDKDLEIGAPYLEKNLDLKVVALEKTEKVDIFKYKSKSRYRRHTGHRQGQTVIEVVETKTVASKTASVPTKKTSKPKTAKKTTEEK